jgi:hypothetical protein
MHIANLMKDSIKLLQHIIKRTITGAVIGRMSTTGLSIAWYSEKEGEGVAAEDLRKTLLSSSSTSTKLKNTGVPKVMTRL